LRKTKNKSILILSVLSIFLCGCPGVTILLMGFLRIVEVLERFESFSLLLTNLNSGNLDGVWMICISSIFILIPLVLVTILLIKRSQKPTLTTLEPTGASQDDPIPPTR
jgi:hypothetical protein